MPLIASTVSALPTVKSLTDCVDFGLTVKPFLPQLQTFPQQLVNHLSSYDDLKTFYATTNPLISAFAFALFLSPLCLVISEFTRNFSQVDRLWSVLPMFYNAHYALWAHVNGLPTQRIDNVLACSVAWSARLTYNYWRKGGYTKGSEDYRWPVIKSYIPSWAFFIFNVTFISLYQNLLLCAIAAPSYALLLASTYFQPTMTITDIVIGRSIIGLVIFEYFADQQQWDFHQAKKVYSSTAKVPEGYSQEVLDRGFLTSGLWAYSRHPNFAAEQSVWVVLYLWALWATGSYINWTIVGALNLLAVFQGSTWLTELLSSRKYPDYKEYQKRVGRFLPKITGPGVADWNKKAEDTKSVGK